MRVRQFCFVFFSSIMLSFTCCTSSHTKPLNSQKGVLKCEVVELNDPLEIDQVNIIDTVRFLKLEDKENALFGHITKLRVYQDRIFILDKRYALAVLIYDREGKHIKTLNSKGRGPGEYLYLSNMEIDYQNKHVIILDNFLSKIIFFDFDGNFVKEIISQAGAEKAACLKNNFTVHAKFADDYWKDRSKNDRIQIIITDKNGEIIKKQFHHEESADLHIQLQDVIRGLPDTTVNYAPVLQDTIYSVWEDGTLHAKYALNYKNKVNENFKISGKHGDLMREIIKGKNAYLGFHIETERYLYCKLGIGWKCNPVFYSKKSKKAIVISRERGNTQDLFEPLAGEGDCFYGMILPSQIKKIGYSNAVIDKHNLDVNEDSNPLLFYYKLRNF